MAIFRAYVEDLWPKVPTLLRRFGKNIINLTAQQMFAAQDVIAEALEDFIDRAWPIPTASTWILDQHWLPYHNLQRNGTTDDVAHFAHLGGMLGGFLMIRYWRRQPPFGRRAIPCR